MSNEGLVKGAVAGAGAALVLMYLYKRNQQGISKLVGGIAGNNKQNTASLKKMSDEKLAELKDNIEDIIAERESAE